ncbi:MAG: hypothetical protein U0414_44180 [Polyangiaceae bacterium]
MQAHSPHQAYFTGAILAIAIAIGAAACGTKSGPSSSSTASSTAAVSASIVPSATASAKAKAKPKGDELEAAGPLKLTVDGQELVFKSGVLKGGFASKTLTLTLSTNETLQCKGYDVGENYLELDIAPGPDGDFYADQTVPTGLTVRVAQTPLVTPWHTGKIRVSAFKQGAEKVTVGLRVDAKIERFDSKNQKVVRAISGGGTLDVAACWDDERMKQAFPVTKVPAATTNAVAGKFGSAEFAAKKAFAYLAHDALNDVDYISSIEFFDSDQATCDNTSMGVFMPGRIDGLRVLVYPSLTSRRKFLGVAEPTPIAVNKQEGTRESLLTFGSIHGPIGVVTLYQAELKEGAVIKGMVAGATGPLPDDHKEEEAWLAGQFEATVCKRQY